MRRITYSSFLLLSICVNAYAAEPFDVGGWFLPRGISLEKLGINSTLSDCLGTLEGRSVTGRRDCLGRENQMQDIRLNRAYFAAMQKLNPKRQDILRRSQRAWLLLLPTQCELEAGPPTGGSDWVEELAICDLEWRAYRSLMLESVVE